MSSYGWGSDTADNWSGGGSGFNYGGAEKSYEDFTPAPSVSFKGKKEKSYADPPSLSAKDMKSIYMVSARVMDAALPEKDKLTLKDLVKSDVLIIPGQYDSVQNVFETSKTPFTLVNHSMKLDPRQLVFVNCPGGNFDYLKYENKSQGIESLREFVNAGGFLVTTDWALDHVVTKAFPGYVKHSGKDTSNDVVEVDLIASQSPYTKGLGNGSLKPIWWLEGSSYPIQTLRKEGVDVLLGSEEMRKKYGYNPIAVKFPFGEGRVIHVTSHFYLQTTKSKYDAQGKMSGLDFATKFIGMAKEEASEINGIESVSFGALESAYTSIRFLHNILLEKMKKNSALEAKLLQPPELKNLISKKGVSIRKLKGPTN